MLNYSSSFERKPGRWVYIPTKDAVALGKKIIKDLSRYWTPPEHFYHFKRRGGHVSASRKHLENGFIANRDIEDFFGSITRSKINRALCKIGVPRRTSFDVAYCSSVVNKVGRPVLPYGFVQSMMLASIVLDKSMLGATLRSSKEQGVLATVYVDDIIISSQSEQLLTDFLGKLDAAAATSNFSFANGKSNPPSREVTNFNCRLGSDVFELTQERMTRFENQLVEASEFGQAAILDYVGAINQVQMKLLEQGRFHHPSTTCPDGRHQYPSR